MKIEINDILQIAVPEAANEGAKHFANSIPLPWLEKILRQYHDDYGEFDYETCAADIKRRMIKQANKNIIREQTNA